MTNLTRTCPKCYGDTELILTNRDAEGWLVGPMVRKTCDYCEGEGKVEPNRAVRVYEVVNHPAEPPIVAPVLTQSQMCVAWAKNAFDTTEQPKFIEPSQSATVWGNKLVAPVEPDKDKRHKLNDAPTKSKWGNNGSSGAT